ncbi:MAG: ATP-binding protein [Spirochaetaceae bacterium]|nr:ATP-binding protein [Spirochaetaceae bacterium]
MIERLSAESIKAASKSKKIVILLGARQVGKTTLLKSLFQNSDSTLWLNGDELDVQNLFAHLSAERFKAYLGKNKILIIDEAQRIEDIGLRLKVLADSITDIQIFATGSSSFDLANRVNEPLTGRKREFHLFPLSFKELVSHSDLLTEKRMIPHRLVFGSYPEVVMSHGNEIEILKELSQSYLYKDILSFEKIRHSDKLTKLLQALAWQIGSQVSYNELAQVCSIDSKTVEHYITILEQAFIIFRLGTFSRNLRNELKNNRKIYFYDNGIRNAIIANFSAAENRNDTGALWENYLISERMKKNAYDGIMANTAFWRTKEQQEIDYLEEQNGMLYAYEFKWSQAGAKKARFPLTFSRAYPNAEFSVITPQNVEDFLL